MLCPACKRKTTALFTSYVCDYCDGIARIEWLRGFMVFRGDEDFGRPIYVFPTQTDAAVYRSKNTWQQYPLREVRFEYPVPWNALTYDTNLEGFVTRITADQLKSAPTLVAEHTWNDRAWETKLHQHYGTPTYWETGPRPVM